MWLCESPHDCVLPASSTHDYHSAGTFTATFAEFHEALKVEDLITDTVCQRRRALRCWNKANIVTRSQRAVSQPPCHVRECPHSLLRTGQMLIIIITISKWTAQGFWLCFHPTVVDFYWLINYIMNEHPHPAKAGSRFCTIDPNHCLSICFASFYLSIQKNHAPHTWKGSNSLCIFAFNNFLSSFFSFLFFFS